MRVRVRVVVVEEEVAISAWLVGGLIFKLE